MPLISLQQVNSLTKDLFIKQFENIVEHHSQIAVHIFMKLPIISLDGLSRVAYDYLESLTLQAKEEILRLHPDLAGRLADQGGLTTESTEEQKSAGLHLISTEEKKQLTKLNEKYVAKFGFPFVICARLNKFPMILQGIEKRLPNTKEDEIIAGIEEVKKICNLRILQIVSE